MGHQFRKHYTREEARALLPEIRGWLDELLRHREQLRKADLQLSQMLARGADLGGATVNQSVQLLCAIKRTLHEFQRREIQLKELDRGLIDFPALIGDREVFLCWEKGEEDIEFWHDLDTGYAGRERLI